MELINKEVQGIFVAEPQENRLDAASAKQFKEQMIEAVQNGNDRIVLNMGKLEFIDSTGMSAIVSVLKQLGLKGGEIVICELTPAVKNLFQLTKLDRVFKICLSEEDSIRAFSGNG